MSILPESARVRNRAPLVARSLAAATLIVALAWPAFGPLTGADPLFSASLGAVAHMALSVTHTAPNITIKPASPCPGGSAEC